MLGSSVLTIAPPWSVGRVQPGEGRLYVFLHSVASSRDSPRIAYLWQRIGANRRTSTNMDAPSLDCAYKLQEYAGSPRRKKSEGKATWPGRKQVYRFYNGDEQMSHDVLALETEALPSNTPLIIKVMESGRRVFPKESLEVCRRRTLDGYRSLPPALGSLEQSEPYPVEVSQALRALAAQLDEAHR